MSVHSLFICSDSACITCKYSYKHRMYTDRKKIFKDTPRQTRDWLCLNLSGSVCWFWSQFYWTNSVYLAHTVFILRNNNTTVPGGSCSHCSGFYHSQGEQRQAPKTFHVHWCDFWGFHLFWEGRVPHPLRVSFWNGALYGKLEGKMRC